MEREYYLLIILLLFSSCVPDTIRNRNDRHEYITELLGPQVKEGITNWDYVLCSDSTREVRNDSIAVRLIIDLSNKYSSYRKLETSLETLFPEGETNTIVGKLNAKQLEIYKKMVDLLPQMAELRLELKRRIGEFKPSYAPVSIVKTRTSDTLHCFFFNGRNELVSHLQYENTYAFDLDKIFADFMGERYDPFYAPTFANSVECLDSISEFDYLIEKSTPVYVYRYVSHSEEANDYPSAKNTDVTSAFPNGANLYEVTKQTYVTTTRDGYDRLINHANANDLSGIDLMVVNGGIGILNPGDVVMMLDIGFAVSEVKNKHGNVIFVDTGSIRKMD